MNKISLQSEREGNMELDIELHCKGFLQSFRKEKNGKKHQQSFPANQISAKTILTFFQAIQATIQR